MNRQKMQAVSASLAEIMENLTNVQKSLSELKKEMDDVTATSQSESDKMMSSPESGKTMSQSESGNEKMSIQYIRLMNDIKSTQEKNAFKLLGENPPSSIEDISSDVMQKFREEVEFMIARDMCQLIREGETESLETAKPAFSSVMAQKIADEAMQTMMTWTNRLRTKVENGDFRSMEDIQGHLKTLPQLSAMTQENLLNVTEEFLSKKRMTNINHS